MTYSMYTMLYLPMMINEWILSDVLSSLSSLPSGSTENQSSLTTPEHSLQSTTVTSQSTVSKLVSYSLY